MINEQNKGTDEREYKVPFRMEYESYEGPLIENELGYLKGFFRITLADRVLLDSRGYHIKHRDSLTDDEFESILDYLLENKSCHLDYSEHPDGLGLSFVIRNPLEKIVEVSINENLDQRFVSFNINEIPKVRLPKAYVMREILKTYRSCLLGDKVYGYDWADPDKVDALCLDYEKQIEEGEKED